MSSKGRVYFKDQKSGSIEKLTDASFEFRYQAGAPSVSLTLPNSTLTYQSPDLFAFFDGLIPEGWLLNIVRKNWKIPANDRMALLLNTCQDCIGAAHILQEGRQISATPLHKPQLGPLDEKTHSSDRCLVCLDDLKPTEYLYHKKCSQNLFGFSHAPFIDVSLTDLEDLALTQVNQRLTLTGVQKKLSLSPLIGEDKKERLTVGLDGSFILKPPTEEFPEMPEIEHISMKLAELQGLRIASCGLAYLSSGERCYITRRFDRVGGQKIQMEDFCQLSEKPTSKKYSGSSENMGKIIDRFSNQAPDDRLTLFHTVLFSFWIGNSDMHLKNFSLWRDPDNQFIRMSPGYDFLSTRLLISKKEDPEELALPINGKKNKLTWSDFVKFGDNLKIPTKVQLRLRDQLLDLQKESLALIARSFLKPDTQKKFTSLLREHSKRLS